MAILMCMAPWDSFHVNFFCTFSEPVEPNMATKDEMADFDNVITNFMKEQGIPGASLCVAKGGHIIYTQSMSTFL